MFVEDHAAFFADFGILVPELGQGVRAIFDAAYDQGSVGMIGMASTQPMLLCRSADLPAGEPVGLQLTIAGTLYAMVHAEPDGTGMTRLLLERAA